MSDPQPQSVEESKTADEGPPPPPLPLADNNTEKVVSVEKEENEKGEEKEDWEIQRDHHKQQGDNAFRCGGFKTAIDEYSKAIALDPDYVVAYSNRSAAYLKNGEKSKALRDAEKLVTELDPTYAKGHSRLAAALHSLRRYDKALDSYQQVLALDATNPAAQRGVEDCRNELARIQKEQQTQKEEEEEKEEKLRQQQEKEEKEEEEAQKSKEVNEEEGEDDGLDDFFAEVEEVTKKQPEEEEKPKATNNIKHDRKSLGTTETQMERLLQSNFEWRNLNAFYVLQLPQDASEDDISRRYKALSLLLHPDKNGGSERSQQAYDQVQKAKTILSDPDRAKHTRMLVEEGLKSGEIIWRKQNKKGKLKNMQEKEVMRIFAQVEQKRREVEQRERKYEQRERQQEDDEMQKERNSRQFDKKWRNEDRVDKRVGNWRDFAGDKKKKKI
jgi:tetratricopeptide (TPR) repeat protein